MQRAGEKEFELFAFRRPQVGSASYFQPMFQIQIQIQFSVNAISMRFHGLLADVAFLGNLLHRPTTAAHFEDFQFAIGQPARRIFVG